MRHPIFFILISFLCFGPLMAQLVTKVHEFEYASPALVERQIRALVPEGPRVSMHPDGNKVLVIADEETQTKIAAMLKALGRPPRQMVFKIRHNRDELDVATGDGAPFTLPVSQTPPAGLVEIGRGRLAPEARNLPVMGSAIQVNAYLLREDPDVVRLRLVPALIYGPLQPYQVVTFDELAQDLMLTTEEYIELQEKYKQQDFYRRFLQTQPDPAAAPRPVSLLISFEGLELMKPAAPADEN